MHVFIRREEERGKALLWYVSDSRGREVPVLLFAGTVFSLIDDDFPVPEVPVLVP